MNAQPSVDDTSTDDSPLSEEQLALYRARLESGYYHSPDVIKHVAERITNELHPPKID